MFSLRSVTLVANLRLDVSVENAVAVHVFDGLQQLVHVQLDARLG